VISFEPGPDGGLLTLEIYCCPKLSQSFLKGLSSANTLAPEDIKGLTSRALVGIQPWLLLTLGDLREVLKAEPGFSNQAPFSLEAKATPLNKMFDWLDENPLYRHHLFMQPTPVQRQFMFQPELKLRGGAPVIGSYLQALGKAPGAKDAPDAKDAPGAKDAELLKLTYIYEWIWPEGFHRNEGITCSVETILKSFTSNSVFKLIPAKVGSARMDRLNLESPDIQPEDFLNHAPSEKFKLRKAIFTYQWH